MKKKQLDINDIKAVLVRMLKDFDTICTENGIRYSVAFGTMLGAIRHKGFIPWDDDVDLIIPRKDFEKLKSYFKKNHEKYSLVSCETQKDFNSILPKIVDNSTILIQHTESGAQKKRSYHLGVYIDLFILDEIPDDKKEREEVFKRAGTWQKEWAFFYFTPNSNHSGAVNALRKVANGTGFAKNIARDINTKAQKYHGKSYGNLLMAVYPRSADIVPKKEFDDLIEVDFEELKLKCLKSYDRMLTGWYKDYMKLPPVEQRVTHHTFDAYWK